MRLGNSHVMTEYVLHDESGEYVELTKVDHEKDLSAWISSDLKPSLHCSKAIATTMRVLSMTRRTFANISKELFIILYKHTQDHIWNIVRQYGAPVWLKILRH